MRFLLHIAVVALIASGVFSTSVLSSAIPGSASIQDAAPSHSDVTSSGFAAITATFKQTTFQPETLSNQLAQQQPSADLLAAVVSLEASTTSEQVQESVQRIQSLGLPQQSPAIAQLLEATATAEPEDDAPEGSLALIEPEEDDDACAEHSSTAYCIYTVAQGDTLSGIAARLGFTGNESLSAAEMLAQSNRPDVLSTDHIETGQRIRVPRESGIVHTVLFAETASEIAADYGITLEALLASQYNAIGAGGVISIGQDVFVPNPHQLPVNEEVEIIFAEATPEPEPTAAPTEEPTEVPEAEPTEAATEEPTPRNPNIIPQLGALNTPTPEPTATSTPEPTATPQATTAVATATAAATRTPSSSRSTSQFIWPTQGPISSYFGPSHPLGIDIDLYANPNADIVASRAGEVVFAGGDPCCSYGYYVIVDHGDGVQTLYAHLSRILVSTGEYVSQGELLGYGGSTGNSTGAHLHFEIRVNGNVVDPLRYLP